MIQLKFNAYPTKNNTDKTVYTDWQDTTLPEVYGFDGGDLYNVVQSVGIKDNQGKIYFFDDIVKFPDDSIGVLVWMGDCLGVGSGEINNYHAVDQVRDIELSDCRIIGNIHQNPDLINS